MRIHSFLLGGIVLTIGTATLASVQAPPDESPRHLTFAEIEAKMKEPNPDFVNVHDPQLTAALEHPDKLVDFITDPATPMLLRSAAAVQGASAVPVDQVPDIVSKIHDLQKELVLHHWGMRQHPMSAVGDQMRIWPPPGVKRDRLVLGHAWKIPDQRVDYPLNFDESTRAPWPFQASGALGSLFQNMARSAENSDGWKQWLNVAMKMPCKTDDQAMRFIEATEPLHFHKTPAVMARYRQIAENPNMPNASSAISSDLQTIQLWRDEREGALTELIVLAELKRIEPDTAVRAAYSLHARDRRHDAGASRWKPWNAALVLCNMVTDQQLDDWTRYYSFASGVCAVIDNPPIKPDMRLRRGAPEIPGQLKTFADWFEKEKPRLTEEAAKEKDKLEQVKKESDEEAAKFEVKSAR